jgi:hypothetical protein
MLPTWEGRGQYCLGRLIDSSGSSAAPLRLINTSEDLYNYYSVNEGLSSDLARANTVFSLVDGQGGPGYMTNRTTWVLRGGSSWTQRTGSGSTFIIA